MNDSWCFSAPDASFRQDPLHNHVTRTSLTDSHFHNLHLPVTTSSAPNHCHNPKYPITEYQTRLNSPSSHCAFSFVWSDNQSDVDTSNEILRTHFPRWLIFCHERPMMCSRMLAGSTGINCHVLIVSELERFGVLLVHALGDTIKCPVSLCVMFQSILRVTLWVFYCVLCDWVLLLVMTWNTNLVYMNSSGVPYSRAM